MKFKTNGYNTMKKNIYTHNTKKMLEEINSLLNKYNNIENIEKIIEICKEKIKIQKYEEAFANQNDLKLIKLNYEYIGGTYDKYDRSNESYSQDTNFDIEHDNKKIVSWLYDK